MKHYLKAIFTLITFALLTSTLVQAGSEEKMIIALKTNDFEMTETDISDLAIGESHTIETESGKVIDILRTADGAEIYIDGELLEMASDGQGLHAVHTMQKHVEIICDSDADCDENVFVFASDDADAVEWLTEDGENFVIHKEIELSCNSDGEETGCSDKMVWVSEGDDVDLETLHEMHMNGEGDGEAHKVIIIRKHVVIED